MLPNKVMIARVCELGIKKGIFPKLELLAKL